jgi:cytochrome c2
MRGGDELNLIHEGGNYGWPLESYGTLYNLTPIPNLLSYGRHDTYERPIYAWLPSVATSHVSVIRGFHAAWNGDLLVTSFKGALFRVHVQDDRVIFAERIDFPGYRFRYGSSRSDGTIVLWTDEYELIFLKPAGESYAAGRVDDIVAALNVSDAVRAKLRVSLDTCSQCHSFDARINESAPNLGDVPGRPIGSTPFASYSPALSQKGGSWTDDAIVQFLDDPKAFAPGTTMPDPNLDDPELIRAIVDFLKAVGNEEE